MPQQAVQKNIQNEIEHSFDIFPWVQRHLDLPKNRLTELTQISSRTLDRRKQKGEFEPPEWERIYRFKELLQTATRIIGSEENAKKWLKTPKKVLGGQTPLDVAKSETGAREVFRVLGRIEHGVFG
jgi:putative toxin-antitoxin system antitoxin component (TIGR02293 family)